MSDEPLDPFDEPIRHVVRMAPPWAAENRTVCGRQINDVKVCLNYEEAKKLINKVGAGRARFLFCDVCMQRQSYKMQTPGRFWHEPAQVTADWCQRALWRKTVDAEQIRNELFALADLVERHRDEYDAMVHARNTDEMAAWRKQKDHG